VSASKELEAMKMLRFSPKKTSTKIKKNFRAQYMLKKHVPERKEMAQNFGNKKNS